MFKNILRFLIITLIAVALGLGIYHLAQPTSASALRADIGRFGGEHDFGEGGFGLIGGLFGITGNLILVAILTFSVVSIQKIFARKPEPAATR